MHSKEFDTVANLTIPQQTSYPWQAYNESMEGLANGTNWLRGKAVILFPPAPTDLEYVNDSKLYFYF